MEPLILIMTVIQKYSIENTYALLVVATAHKKEDRCYNQQIK